MSTLSSDDHLNPHNPLYYAPRRLREKPQRASTSSVEARLERLRRLNSSPPVHDALLEQAVAEALSRPHESEAVREPAGFARERDGRKGSFRIAVRAVAAVGVAAIVALLFVIMVPVAQNHAGQPDGSSSSVAGILASVKAAFDPPHQGGHEAKPAASEFETILATSRTEQGVVTHEQSETLLQQFLQWQGKPTQTH